MKNIVNVFFLLAIVLPLFSQDTSGTTAERIVRVNDAIEKALLDRNSSALDTLFGNDLLFIHGGGNVDNKISYMSRVPKSFYASRKTDSTRVELHDISALVTGRVTVYNGGEHPKPPYGIRYVRLFLLKNDHWVLVSHRTIQKWDETK